MTGPRLGILVSSPPPADLEARIAAGEAPRRDYFLLRDRLGAELLFSARTSWLNRLCQRLTGMDWSGAWRAFRRRGEFDVLLCDSEHVGLPLAALLALCRRPPALVVIGHRPAAWKKTLFVRLTGAARRVTRLVCYGGLQARLARRRWGLSEAQVTRVLHPADAFFWRPGERPKERLVLSAGLEYRDYPTLLAAAMGLDADIYIAAASPWSKRADETAGKTLPPNVRIGRLTPVELREAQERAAVVVVPLYPVDFQAGTLVIYEAMAMGNAVVATRTPSHALGEVIRDGQDGVLVTAEDVGELRQALEALLDDAERRERLGRAARARVEGGLNLDEYVENMAAVVAEVLAERDPHPEAKEPAAAIGGR